MTRRVWMVRIPGSSGNTCTAEVDLWHFTGILVSAGNDAVQVIVSNGAGLWTRFGNTVLQLPVELRRLKPEHAEAVEELLLAVRFHVQHHGEASLIEECGHSMCHSAYEEFLKATGGEQEPVTGEGSE